MRLYYVGEIYDYTSTMFSPLWTPEGGRSDWGKVHVALSDGDNVGIEQAPLPFREDIYRRAAEYINETARSSSGWLWGVGNYDTPPEHLDLLIEGVLARIRLAMGL